MGICRFALMSPRRLFPFQAVYAGKKILIRRQRVPLEDKVCVVALFLNAVRAYQKRACRVYMKTQFTF